MSDAGGLISAVFDLDITAVSSIVHRDDTRTATSTHQLFRREQILTPDWGGGGGADCLRQRLARGIAAHR